MHYEFLCTHLFTVQLTLCIPILLFVFLVESHSRHCYLFVVDVSTLLQNIELPILALFPFFSFFYALPPYPKIQTVSCPQSIQYHLLLWPVSHLFFCDKSCHRAKSKNKQKRKSKKAKETKEMNKQKLKQNKSKRQV